MKIIETYLLKENDKVVSYGKTQKVTETAKNETIKVGEHYRYFSEIQTVEDYKNRTKHNNYKSYSFLD